MNVWKFSRLIIFCCAENSGQKLKSWNSNKFMSLFSLSFDDGNGKLLWRYFANWLMIWWFYDDNPVWTFVKISEYIYKLFLISLECRQQWSVQSSIIKLKYSSSAPPPQKMHILTDKQVWGDLHFLLLRLYIKYKLLRLPLTFQTKIH